MHYSYSTPTAAHNLCPISSYTSRAIMDSFCTITSCAIMISSCAISYSAIMITSCAAIAALELSFHW